MLIARCDSYCPEEKPGLTRRGAPSYRFKAGAKIRSFCPDLLFEPFSAVMWLVAMASPRSYRTFRFSLKEDFHIATFLDERCHGIRRLPLGRGAINIVRLFHQSGLKILSESRKVVPHRSRGICTSTVNSGVPGLSPLRVGRLFRRSHFQGEDSSGDVHPFGPSTRCATAAEQGIIDGSSC